MSSAIQAIMLASSNRKVAPCGILNKSQTRLLHGRLKTRSAPSTVMSPTCTLLVVAALVPTTQPGVRDTVHNKDMAEVLLLRTAA